ncbi:uncharacterized protein LOC118803833 [Colossoma macropomum]|uniref:uncharacterized protein LOC118803833 n=1 Tax=Colossoma macropomum TaxID=42526 RepID=UPI0018647FDD|nr:uncharacterized protein LOC118803833 [Colossoma macropomum]
MATDGADNGQVHGGDEEVISYFTTGAPIIFDFIAFLQGLSPKLKEVPTVEKCDFILFFCQSFSETKTDIESALLELSNTEPAKPVLLVVLHYTSDPDSSISDSSEYVRENTLTVDCLIYEDENLLQCRKNDEALTKAKEWIMSETEKKKPEIQPSRLAVLFVLHYTSDTNIRVSDNRKSVTRENILTVDCLISGNERLLNCPQNDEAVCKVLELIPEVAEEASTDYTPQLETKPVKIFADFTERTLRFFEDFVRILCKKRPTLQEVPTVDECDVVLVFCPVVSQAGTEIEAALHKLSDMSDSIVSDHNRCVTRKNTITVDCLFYEDKTLLKCAQNANTHPEGGKKRPFQTPPVETKPLKIFSCVTGKTLGSHEDFVRSLCRQRPTLQEVLTVEECDVVLVFCPVVSRAGTDIEAALQKLSDIPATEPAVLVVLHHTFDPECTVSDSSRAVDRQDTLTVDCLFHEDRGLLQCRKNDEALCKVADWLIPEGAKPPKSPVKEAQRQESLSPPVETKPVKFFSWVNGKTLGSHEDFVRSLCRQRPTLQEVLTVEDCDVVLVFCPVVSRAGTDVEAALQKSDISATEPAVLVVLHHTFDPDSTVPDSSRAVTREKTLTVDCLFYEDKGLLQCRKNDEAFRRVSKWIDTQAGIKTNVEFSANTIQTKFTDFARQFAETKSKGIKHFDNLKARMPEMTRTVMKKIPNPFSLPQKNKGSSSITGVSQDLPQVKLHLGKLNFVTCVTGKTLGSHEDFVRILCKRRAELQEVHTVEECDVILAFCPVVTLAGLDTERALRQLNDMSGSKPAVLVVLHHTFDPELIVPDSSKSINREKTLAVDCLFHEDRGLLQCRKNDEALCKVADWLIPEGAKPPKSPVKEAQRQESLSPPVETKPVKIFSWVTGKTLGCHEDFVRSLCRQRPTLQEVPTVEDCDVVLVFCPVVSRAGTDIAGTCEKLYDIRATKPAVLVVLHHTLDPECTVPDSSRAVNREKTLTVDCLFYEDKGLLQCRKNDEAFRRVSKWIDTQAGIKTNVEFSANTIQTKFTDFARQFAETKSKGIKHFDNLKARMPEMTRTKNKGSSSITGVSQDLPQVKLHLGKLNFFTCVTGKTLGFHEDFVRILCKRRAELQEVHTVEECDVILAFCPVPTLAGHDTERALRQFNDMSGSKPAVLVVLNHTFDPELIVPDTSRSVNRDETLTVDCLFNEDKGLLQCRKNDEAFSKVSEWIQSQRNCESKHRKKMAEVVRQGSGQKHIDFLQRTVKYISVINVNTLDSHKRFLGLLSKLVPSLQEVSSVEECDVMFVFYPVVSRADIDIKHAEKTLRGVTGSKPAALVMLHHTLNTKCFVHDSSASVTREKTIAVDCLFHEDHHGLLRCQNNDKALAKVTRWLTVAENKPESSGQKHLNQKIKYSFIISENTLDSHVQFLRKIPNTKLQEVSRVEECDVILVFCPVVSRVQTDIEGALQRIDATKPAVLVLLHHTSDPERTLPDSSTFVNREDTITVDCLFFEDTGLLECQKNSEAFREVSTWLKAKVIE